MGVGGEDGKELRLMSKREATEVGRTLGRPVMFKNPFELNQTVQAYH